MITAGNYYAFQTACQNGHLKMIHNIYDWWSPKKIYLVISSERFDAFRSAFRNCHFDILDKLSRWASPKEREAMTAFIEGLARF